MRILIIGGSGLSGPYVVRQLCGLGHEVLLFNRGQSRGNLPDSIYRIQGDKENIIFFGGQLQEFKPQVVLHMIATFESDARNVMDIFRGIAERIVMISSQDVYLAYGRIIGTEPGPPIPVPLSEDSPIRTRLYPYREQAENPEHFNYSYEKILVERGVMNDPVLPGTVLRLPMVYGPGDVRHHRILKYLKRMDDNRPAILLDRDFASWRWTKGYVENIAEAIVLAVTDHRAAGEIYNIGDRETPTEREWVAAIGRMAGWEGRIITVSKDDLPENLVMDINTAQHLVTDSRRIRDDLNFRERVTIDEGLKRTIAWERKNAISGIDPGEFDYTAEDSVLARLGGEGSFRK